MTNVSRKYYVVMMLLLTAFLALGAPTLAAGSHPFNDVGKRQNEAISELYRSNVINGISKTEFGVHKELKRGDAAVILARALGLDTNHAPKSGLQDLNSRIEGHVNALVHAGIMGGFTETEFSPDSYLTRGQMAKVLVNAYDLEKYAKETSYIDLSKTFKKDIEALYGAGITKGINDKEYGTAVKINRGDFAVLLYKTMNFTGEDISDPVKEDEDSKKVKTPKEIFSLNNEKVVVVTTNRAQGSGVIVGNGLVLTNAHVVEGMQSATITLNTGNKVDIAGIVQVNKTKDLALIKTKTPIDIKPVLIGNTSKLEVGEDVAAIGSPKGLQNTLSTGIISSLRTVDGVKHIQTTASITNGSSGGGLFNQYGELIGVTTWGKGETGNLNFAVDIAEMAEWNQYLNMKFNDIPIITVDAELVKVIRGISMGMTRSEVKNIETGTLIGEEQNTLYYYNTTQYGFPVGILYEFNSENKLEEVFVSFEGMEYLSLDNLETLYVYLLGELETQFGKADYIDADWFDDGGYYSLSAIWLQNNKRSDIYMQVKIDSDYSSSSGILFTLKN